MSQFNYTRWSPMLRVFEGCVANAIFSNREYAQQLYEGLQPGGVRTDVSESEMASYLEEHKWSALQYIMDCYDEEGAVRVHFESEIRKAVER